MTEGYVRDKADSMWWCQAIRKGIEHRNKVAMHSNWNEWRNFYRGNFSFGVHPHNVYFKMIRSMVPRIYFRNPGVSITPRKGQQGAIDYAILAQLLERLDNTMLDRIRLKHSMKRAIQDGIMFGTGVLKLGYGGEFTMTPPPVGSTEAPTSDKGYRYEYHDFIQPDMPWVLRVRTQNFVVPPGCEDWPSARWCAMITRRHVDDVRDDPRLKNVADIKEGVTTIPGMSGEPLSGMVDLYEIRDKKTKRVIVIAPYSNTSKILLEEDDDLQIQGRLPYFPIIFNADDEWMWGLPDAHIMRAHQLERNQIATMIRAHRRVSINKYIMKKGAISPDNMTKLNSDEVNAIIELDEDRNISDIQKIEAADIPAGLMKTAALEDQAVQEILGLGVNQFGEYAPGSSDRSATEANIVNQSAMIRTDERRDVCADVIVELVEQMNHLILNRWSDQEQIVDILGPEGAQLWVSFKPIELRSLDYDVKVDPDSSTPETREYRQQKAAMIFKTFYQDPLIDQVKLHKFVLGEVGGPSMTDMLVQQAAPPGAPALGAPGTPGSSPGQPMPVGQLITQAAARQRGGPKQV